MTENFCLTFIKKKGKFFIFIEAFTNSLKEDEVTGLICEHILAKYYNLLTNYYQEKNIY